MADIALGAERQDKRKVMIAIDESECSKIALEWAIRNLDNTLKSNGLILFNAIPLEYAGVFATTYGSTLPANVLTSIQDNQKKFAEALLVKAKDICAMYGVNAETISVLGNPKDAICDAVQKFQCQLLVMGSHSRGVIGRAVLGSVSNYCVHHAKCPVLVVKQPVCNKS
ncbi:universal stress protein A-like protein [Amaranthus tricolor]|uniref:universal stress protein A-like protein n=1 Tax=Amaranthus tricolor TaxID=29722 RepID=UPI00258D89D7|nr:universal stress protein A-like protein [Amaranthus tricolor]